MNDEPTYEYIKGQGWVPTTHEMFTGIIGKWHVTLIKRKPEIGEYYWSDTCSLEQTFRNLARQPHRVGDSSPKVPSDGVTWCIPEVTMLLKPVDSGAETG